MIELGIWWLFWNWFALPGCQGHEGEASSGCHPPSPTEPALMFMLSWVLMIFAALMQEYQFYGLLLNDKLFVSLIFFPVVTLHCFSPLLILRAASQRRGERTLLSFSLVSSYDGGLLLSTWHTPEEVEELPRSNWPVVGSSVGNCLDYWLLSEGPALCGRKHPWEGCIRKPGDDEPECGIVSHMPTHFKAQFLSDFLPWLPLMTNLWPVRRTDPFLTSCRKGPGIFGPGVYRSKGPSVFSPCLLCWWKAHLSFFPRWNAPSQFALVFSGVLDSLFHL